MQFIIDRGIHLVNGAVVRLSDGEAIAAGLLEYRGGIWLRRLSNGSRTSWIEWLPVAESRHRREHVCRLTNRCTDRLTIASLRYRSGRQSSSAGELGR